VDINLTLIGQMITFAIFIWFTMKYVWPPLENMLKVRQERIADGLHAAERGHLELELAQKTAVKEMREAREIAAQIIDQAHKQAIIIIEQAKADANIEKQNILTAGQAELDQAQQKAREKLKAEVVNLTILSTEKLLHRTMNDDDQKRLLEEELKSYG
jgi:F-type H+-transporting ATPase subunit b